MVVASVFFFMTEQRNIKGSNENTFSNTKYVYSVENRDKAQIIDCFAFATHMRASQMMLHFFVVLTP